MNIVWKFHFANIPLLYGDINIWQNNVLNIAFAFFYLFLFFLAYVKNINYVYYDLLIDNDYFSYLGKKCFISLSFPNIEKIHQQIMTLFWCLPLNFKQTHMFSLQSPSLLYFSLMNPSNNLLQLLCI
jgi:hypothetical protein